MNKRFKIGVAYRALLVAALCLFMGTVAYSQISPVPGGKIEFDLREMSLNIVNAVAYSPDGRFIAENAG
jgi:hypothetical protein